MSIIEYETTDYHGYNVKFSPTGLLSCAASKNYGLRGTGALFLLDRCSDDSYAPLLKFDWPDGLFDLTWNRENPDLVCSCSGDGTLQIWDITKPTTAASVLTGHNKEVYGVDWCSNGYTFMLLSSSADGTINMWDVELMTSVRTYADGEMLVYASRWSPHLMSVFASVGDCGPLRIWDFRSAKDVAQVIPDHAGDVLDCDWDTMNEHVIATAGIDCHIHLWDIRMANVPTSQLSGHELAIRRIQFSPHTRNLLASVSYDYSTRLWDTSQSSVVKVFGLHTEFVYGVAFSPTEENRFADCGFDSLIQIYEGL